jgi:hypothetical protein
MRKWWWMLAMLGCDDAADPVAQMQPVDATIEDAAIDARVDMMRAPDMRIVDAGPGDQRVIDMGMIDQAVDAALDMRPADMAPDMPAPDAAPPDMMPPDMAVPDMQPVDMALPDRCAPWAEVADGMLVAAVHRSLSEAYRPVVPEPDRGGNLNRYTTARYAMFTQAERPLRDDGLECVYTGRVVRTRPDEEPDHGNLNAEHVWPRSRMEPDRDSALYEHQQSDIHHLYPSDSDANSTRGSNRFGEVVADRNLDFLPAVEGLNAQGDRVFEPRDERKGDIARAVFYFSIRWGRGIGPTEEATLRQWAAADPVDARERARNDAVEQVQGNRNPFTDCPELLPRIADFADFAIIDRGLPLP